MADNNVFSVVNIGELAKPATKLIEKISNGLGALYEPHHIRRIAKAEADASIIKADADLKIQEMTHRATLRMIAEQSQQQLNMESIAQKAIPHLAPDSDASEIDNDWITNFLAQSRTVGDTEMQELWARILAGEANAPGTFSRKTINLVSDLDKSDATLFASLCGFVAIVMDEAIPVVLDKNAEIYLSHNINFSALNHLDSMGLIVFDPLAGYVKQQLPTQILVKYFQETIELTIPSTAGVQIRVGTALFTRAGYELARICEANPVTGFSAYLRSKWSQFIPQ